MRRPELVAAVVLSACVGLVGGASAAWAIYHRLGPVERVVTQPATSGSGGGGSTLAEVAADASPGVVTISTRPTSPDGLLNGPTGFANGYIASSDGLIVTTVQGVSGATRLRVALADGRAYDALVAATDIRHGVVVLRAAGAHDLVPLRVASRAPRAGDFSMAVARPPLQAVTIASGTVSSTSSSVDATVDGLPLSYPAIAMAAAPDSAAEGAPLLDDHGAVLGVITQGSTPASTARGILALPVSAAVELVARVGRGAAAAKADLGADSVILDPATAAAAGLMPGALIRTVSAGGACAQAGIARGDIVTQVNGLTMDGDHPLDPAALHLAPGQRITVTVATAGQVRNVALTVASG